MNSSYLAAAPVVRRVRGYFAPVNRVTQTPVIFDAAEMGGFGLDSPPSPWIALGWLKGFTRKAVSKTAQIVSGVPAAVLEQTRETVGAEVSFEFLSWTKLTMVLARASQQMTLLQPATAATASAKSSPAQGSTGRPQSSASPAKAWVGYPSGTSAAPEPSPP